MCIRDRQCAVDIVHVVRNEFLLLGRTQTNEHNIRTACGVDAVNNLLRVREIAVMRAGAVSYTHLDVYKRQDTGTRRNCSDGCR